MKLKDGQISLSTSQDRKTYIKLRKLLDKGLDLAGNNWNWPIAGYLTLPTMQRILNLAWIYDLQIKSSGCIMEFGVHFGSAFAQLINLRSMLEPYNYSRHIHGFDTFEGIPEDWHDEKAGTYSSDGNIPRIEGGEFIVGKFAYEFNHII